MSDFNETSIFARLTRPSEWNWNEIERKAETTQYSYELQGKDTFLKIHLNHGIKNTYQKHNSLSCTMSISNSYQ